MMDSIAFLLAGTLAAATPLLFAAMGEVVVEKSGVLNLGIEGMMASGAAAAFVVVFHGGGSGSALALGALAGLLLSCVFGLLVLTFLAHQVAAGLAVGILGLGASVQIGKAVEGRTIAPMPRIDLGPLSELPVIGRALFGQTPTVYAGLIAVALVWWFLNRSRAGLVVRAVGESPSAADAIGYPVALIRFAAIAFGGVMAGLGGACLTLAYTPLWADGLIAGRGWIVVALVVFGAWRPGRILLGAWLFGAVSLLELALQGVGLAIPSQLMSALPYLVTIVVLALISRDPRRLRLDRPVSLGKTHVPRA